MTARERVVLILGASLVLNAVLLVFLFVSRQDDTSATQPVAQVVDETRLTPTITKSPTVEPTSEPAIIPTAVVVTAAATNEPTATHEPTTTNTPSPTPEPTKAPTATPAATPTQVPSPTAIPVSGPDWLNYVNLFRQEANLPPVVENVAYSVGSGLHSTYMVATNRIDHYEDRQNPWYSLEGDLAAQKGNLVASVSEPPYQWAIEYWISAPFHAVPILDPQLHTVGFGLYRQEEGDTTMAAVMDVLQGIGDLPPDTTYPLPFPRDGGQTWVVRHSLFEYPDTYSSCPGYAAPSGPPIILQIGSGDNTPHVTGHSFSKGGVGLEHCIYDETTYVNSDAYAQDVGRIILDERDAIILLPRAELEMGQTYTVTVVVNGEPVTWSFATVPPPWKR